MFLTQKLGMAPEMATTIGVLIALAVAVVIANLVHIALVALLNRLAKRTASRSDDVVVARIIRPMRWILIAIALSSAERAVTIDGWAQAAWEQAAGFIVPALIGWLAIAITQAFNDVAIVRHDISVADNLAARRKRTRLAILTRIAIFAVLFVTICMMLLSIPGVRSVGVTLMASAGLAGLAVGAAAQPALKNLIAGIQLAFTEPIRIDDVVILDGEWGRIEDIWLTYVVVKIWDERRLIVPVSKFLEDSFQNWTRSSAQLLGTSFFHVDPCADVARLRAKLREIVKDNPNWDGRVVGLQVTDLTADTMELRALTSSADAGKSFDLRCDVREALMAYIASEMPEAIPRRRLDLQQTAGESR
jgi:small-conductance mechanosensitive channel